MYTMEIQVLAEFQLKITNIGDDIPKKQILPKIWAIFGPSFAKLCQNMKTSSLIF